MGVSETSQEKAVLCRSACELSLNSMRRFKRAITCAIPCFSAVLIFAALLPARDARAGILLFEAGGGVSQIRNASPFFGASAPSAPDYGLAGNLGLFYGFGRSNSLINLQLGIEDLLANSTSFDQYYSLLIPYPVLRLQIGRLYVGGGYAPFIFDRLDTTPGLGASSVSGTGILGQFGFLLPVTPKFSLALQADGQFITSGGVASPSPAIDLQVVLRFYFSFLGIGGESGGGGGSSYSSSESQGRYPFGLERGH
jgi:hypothetical protein